MFFRWLDKYREVGLLILRVGIGIAFMFHGVPKLIGGPELWAKVGSAMSAIGLGFTPPTFFGLMAALSEAGGGLLLALGLFARPASAFMFFTMFVATAMHIHGGQDYTVYSHPLKMAIVFASLILIGPGRFSLDEWIAGRMAKKTGSNRNMVPL